MIFFGEDVYAIRKCDFRVSISLLLVRKSDFLVATNRRRIPTIPPPSGGPQPGQARGSACHPQKPHPRPCLMFCERLGRSCDPVPCRLLMPFGKLLRTTVGVFFDLLRFFELTLRAPQSVAAENLFLRKQLALYVERKTKPHRATEAVRFTLAQLSRLFEWRDALTVVKPDTLIRWHRKGFRLFWKWKSRSAGRPRVQQKARVSDTCILK